MSTAPVSPLNKVFLLEFALPCACQHTTLNSTQIKLKTNRRPHGYQIRPELTSSNEAKAGNYPLEHFNL